MDTSPDYSGEMAIAFDDAGLRLRPHDGYSKQRPDRRKRAGRQNFAGGGVTRP